MPRGPTCVSSQSIWAINKRFRLLQHRDIKERRVPLETNYLLNKSLEKHPNRIQKECSVEISNDTRGRTACLLSTRFVNRLSEVSRNEPKRNRTILQWIWMYHLADVVALNWEQKKRIVVTLAIPASHISWCSDILCNIYSDIYPTFNLTYYLTMYSTCMLTFYLNPLHYLTCILTFYLT